MQDRVGRSGPHEGPGADVVVDDKAIDLLGEFFDAAKSAPANGALGNDVEPDLDLVEPGGIGGGEVELVTRTSSEPTLHLGMFVRTIVVDHQVNVQLLRNVGLEMAQELEKLLVAMAPFALGEDGAGGDIEGGEEGG